MKKAIFFLAVLFVLAAAGVFAQQKFALVIGNKDYTGISPLANPVNDANDMETALKGLGFTVEKVLNGNLEQMENAVLNLRRRLGGARNTYGFFFYAGHGVQAGGENYLIPINADNIRSETQLRDRAVSLQFILDSLSEAGNELNMIVLDACRDNPFAWARSGNRGLSVVSHAPTGSNVMYATGANSTALDGAGRNGLFTGHLLNNLKTPGLSVFEVFDKTMGNVISSTNGRQHPELSLRYAGATNAYLGQRPSPGPNPPPNPQPSPQPTPANMVRINGGTFTMGSNNGEDNEKPVHTVTVTGFYMGKYPVTQKEWTAVMGSNPSYFKGDNLPVHRTSWFDAVDYCNRLSQKEGLTSAYTISGSGNYRTVTWNRNANGYRLPTEAEWEYAARGGNGSLGNYLYSGSNNVDEVAWYDENSGGSTQNVGTKKPNGLGLYDMSGNVFELCWDWYGDYSSGAQTDPTGAFSGSLRVLRGGHYGLLAVYVRSAFRYYTGPYDGSFSLGFRLARNGN